MKSWPDSIRWRLTLWYSLSLAAMLATFAAASLYVLQGVIVGRTDRFLESTRNSFSQELSVEFGAAREAGAAVQAALRDMRFADVTFLVYAPGPRLVGASPSAGDVASDSTGDPALALDRGRLEAHLGSARLRGSRLATIPNSEGGHRVALQSVMLGAVPHIVVAAQTRHGLHETLEMVALAYVVVIPVFLTLSALGGYFLARRALSPIAGMSRRAREISATNLHDRVPVENPRDEMGELAAMINELLGRFQGFFEHQRRFVADASHELRTPVAIVRAEAEIALEPEHRSEAEYREALRVVNEAGQRLSRIVDDLFLLARADSGHQPVRREALYLDELTTDVVRSMRGLASMRSVHLSIGALTEAPMVGDPELLGRMLLNLIDNAVKHSPPDGVVAIEVALTDGSYRVSVTDCGPGIPDAAQPHIFDRFFRVDKSRSRADITSTSGAGLGLAIARLGAEAHQGSLELRRSGPGGSEFVVTLPSPAAGTPSGSGAGRPGLPSAIA